MLKVNLNTLQNKIKFQEVGLTSRSCIGGCGGSGACSNCVNSGCGRCKCFENTASIESLDTIYS